MKISKNRKLLLSIILPIGIIILGILSYLVVTQILIPIGYSLDLIDYPIDLEEWEGVPYVALEYGQSLGSEQINGTTYWYSTIRGLNKDEWIYAGYSHFIPANSFNWSVYRKKDATTDPIKDWTVKEILIAGNRNIDDNRVYYSIDGKITDQSTIAALVAAVNGDTVDMRQDLKALPIRLFFVFEECPSLGWYCDVYRSDDGQYYINVGDNKVLPLPVLGATNFWE